MQIIIIAFSTVLSSVVVTKVYSNHFENFFYFINLFYFISYNINYSP